MDAAPNIQNILGEEKRKTEVSGRPVDKMQLYKSCFIGKSC